MNGSRSNERIRISDVVTGTKVDVVGDLENLDEGGTKEWSSEELERSYMVDSVDGFVLGAKGNEYSLKTTSFEIMIFPSLIKHLYLLCELEYLRKVNS